MEKFKLNNFEKNVQKEASLLFMKYINSGKTKIENHDEFSEVNLIKALVQQGISKVISVNIANEFAKKVKEFEKGFNEFLNYNKTEQ